MRLGHLLAVSLLLGGAILMAVAVRLEVDRGALQRFARTYEGLFWAAVGLVVMTGVGNFVVMGFLEGTWATVMTWKLALIGVLLLLSVARTLFVATEPAPMRLYMPYITTAFAFTVVLVLGVWLSHG